MAVPERNCSDTQSDVVDLTGLLFVYLVHRPIGWPNAVPASSRSPAGNANKITVIRIFDNYLITGLLFLFAFFSQYENKDSNQRHCIVGNSSNLLFLFFPSVLLILRRKSRL